MLYSVLVFITDLGDSLLLAACVAVGGATLARAGGTREALVLVFGFGGAALGIGCLKLLCMGCHALVPWLAVTSPSGHTCLATGVIGTATLLVIRRTAGPWQALCALPPLALVLAIAASRVILGMHSRDEVLLGLVVGGITVSLSALLLRGAVKAQFVVWRLVVPLAVIILALNGIRMPAEQIIREIAALLGSSVSVCSA